MTFFDAIKAAKDSNVSTTLVLHDIRKERINQDKKWGEQNHPLGTSPANTLLGFSFFELAELMRDNCEMAAKAGRVTWAHILLEEVFEFLAEFGENKGPVRAEIIQVGAVAAAIAECMDRNR